MPRMSEFPTSDEPDVADLIPIVDVSHGRSEVVSIAQLATLFADGGVIHSSEVDANITTMTMPANTTISAFGATIVDDADAAAVRATIGAAATTDLADTVVLTQSEYDALTPDADTIYYIVGA